MVKDNDNNIVVIPRIKLLGSTRIISLPTNYDYNNTNIIIIYVYLLPSLYSECAAPEL